MQSDIDLPAGQLPQRPDTLPWVMGRLILGQRLACKQGAILGHNKLRRWGEILLLINSRQLFRSASLREARWRTRGLFTANPRSSICRSPIWAMHLPGQGGLDYLGVVPGAGEPQDISVISPCKCRWIYCVLYLRAVMYLVN